MIRVEQIAQAALEGDALGVRSMVQEWSQECRDLSRVPRPNSSEPTLLAVTAAFVELFALRAGESPPAWTSSVGPLPSPLYLLRSAASMPRLRRMCELEAPEPLRRRNIFAPSNYLEAA